MNRKKEDTIEFEMEMRNKIPIASHTVPSFTIFEITVVLAIMSTLITIITVATNRFNEQMKNNQIIQQELNEFYAFRSGLWNELYNADSIRMEQKELAIYRQKEVFYYKIEEDYLYRKPKDREWRNTGFLMFGLKEIVNEDNEEKMISFIFNWKEEPMKLEYLCRPSIKTRIDHFFEAYKR